MYKKHPSFSLPQNDKKIIWKYLDLPRFISLLEKKSLYFFRSDSVEDPYEGSIGSQGKQFWENEFITIPKDKRGKDYDKVMNIFNQMRKFIFINSWHESDVESMAMWKLYSNIKHGIAIQSTIERLIKSLSKTEQDVYIGKVEYINYSDYIIDLRNTFNPYLYKRKSFTYEQEIRVITQFSTNKHMFDYRDEEIPKGFYVQINIETLINSIYIQPSSEPWFHDVVASVCKKFGKNFEVKYSTMDELPIY